jgi:hypothetical protein
LQLNVISYPQLQWEKGKKTSRAIVAINFSPLHYSTPLKGVGKKSVCCLYFVELPWQPGTVKEATRRLDRMYQCMQLLCGWRIFGWEMGPWSRLTETLSSLHARATNPTPKQFWFCSQLTGKSCFADYLAGSVLPRFYSQRLSCISAIWGESTQKPVEWENVTILLFLVHCLLDQSWVVLKLFEFPRSIITILYSRVQ